MNRLIAVLSCVTLLCCLPLQVVAYTSDGAPFPSPVDDAIFSNLVRCINIPQNNNATGAEICHLRASTAYKSAISELYDLVEKSADRPSRLALKQSQERWLSSQQSDFLLWQGNWVNTRGDTIGSQMAAITTQSLQSRLFELYLYLPVSQQAQAKRIIQNAFR